MGLGLGPDGIRGGARDHAFNATVLLSVTADNAEVTLLAPVRVPRVGHLPVLDTAFLTPADKLDGVATSDGTRRVLVDTTGVVLKVRVDGKGRLDGATLHNHLLNLGLTHRRDKLARERVLVVGERAVEASLALGWALGRRRVRAAGGALRGVRVVAHRAVVVAVGERKVRALLAKGTRALVLTARDGALGGDVRPRGGDLATVAAVKVGAKAHVLRRQRNLDLALGGNAHTVRGSFGTAKRPAAAAVGLVADVTNDLGARRPVGLRVERVRDGGIRVLWDKHVGLTVGDGVLDIGVPVTLDATQTLGCTWWEVGEALLRGRLPQRLLRVHFVDLRKTVRVDVDADRQGGRSRGHRDNTKLEHRDRM
eukprot:m.159386 g.159386  ORF g.159386 m.159386 type:complete len:367 (+) comp11786_c0_seq1:2968-4068(+)